jgi:aminopeptidase N
VLAAGDTPRAAAASRLLASTSRDAAQLRRWLDGSSSLPTPDQPVRWLAVARLAALGEPDLIDAEAERDPSAVGALSLLTARASESTVAAKQAAWESLLSGTLSNREVSAVAAGLWGGNVDALQSYLLAAPAALIDLARRSGQGMGKVLGRAFGWMPMPDDLRLQLRDEVANALAQPDVPTVIGRSLADTLDDLDLTIAARSAHPGSSRPRADGQA